MKRRTPVEPGTGPTGRRQRKIVTRGPRDQREAAVGRRPGRKKKRPGMTKKKKIQIAAAITLGTLLVLSLSGYAVWRSLIDKIDVVDPDEETIPSEYNVPTESLINPVPSDRSITNILLLGVDSRDEDNLETRSDSMMILTIDQKNNKIKLTSLQRDMLVYLPGKDEPAKINAANVLGGPMLAVRVVNDTFRLDIKNYAIVNMSGMERLVDLAGGVMIDVTRAEIAYVNRNITSENRNQGQTEQSPLLESAGLQLLNGRQAVAYARVRKLDSDYVRMERQRTVLQALFDAFRDADLVRKGQLISEGLTYIKTNLKPGQITDLGLQVVPAMSSKIEQMQIPVSGFFREDARATWVNRCDFNGMIPLLQEFIWGRTFPFDPVKEIPGAPNSSIPLPTLPPTPTPVPTPEPTPEPTPTPDPSPAPTTAPTTEAATTQTLPPEETTQENGQTDPLPTSTTAETEPGVTETSASETAAETSQVTEATTTRKTSADHGADGQG